MFPRANPQALTGVVMNCAGGMTSGDRFDLTAKAGDGTRLVLTSQAAERAYGANGPDPAQLTTRLTVASGARLDWLPQETILFDQSRLNRRLDVELAEDAAFLMIEPVIFGRVAMGESLSAISFTDQIRIRRAGRLIHADATTLSGDAQSCLQQQAIMGGGHATAAMVFVAAEAENYLERTRALLNPTSGASLKAADLLSIRLIAKDAYSLRKMAMPLITLLSQTDIPKTWTL